jgi:hypothetical protein
MGQLVYFSWVRLNGLFATDQAKHDIANAGFLAIVEKAHIEGFQTQVLDDVNDEPDEIALGRPVAK